MTATMAKYRYQAETLDGENVKGDIEAPSIIAARNQLAVQGLRVTKIAERKGLQIEITKQKIPNVEIMHFCRQMSTFIRAGVPMVEALDNMRRDSKNKRFQLVLGDVLERVTGGSTVADAIAHHADVFPPYFMSMLRSSELTGRMDDSFLQLYRYIKRDVQLTKAVKKALTYPIILLVVACGVVAIITVFVIPKFAEFFESFGAELPLPTRMLMAIADFVGSTAGAITGVVLLLAIVGTVVYVRTPTGRRAVHGLQLKIPALNTVVQYSSTERFTRILGVLLDSGVALSDALPSAIECTNNIIYRERLNDSVDDVLSGHGFAEPMAATEIFPPTMVQMVRVGERTGELADQLENCAGFYEEELDYAVEKLTQWFEPIVILFIGAVVGFVALAMVSAMYGIYGQVEVK